MKNVKIILLIGRTGNGKSTLANVISGTSKFTEGEFTVSETRKISDCVFEYERTKYRIIDTVGIGDTSMKLDKVLRKLALMGYSVKGGLSQILFVTDGQLASEAKSTYDLLEKVVFDEDIAKHTTVVRTNFPGFENDKKRKDEETRINDNSEEFRELIEECKGIIYVDNPPVNIKDRVTFNEERRKRSREILLTHLKNVCQGDVYKPDNLNTLNDLIGKYMNEKEELKRKKNWLEKARNRLLNTKINKKMLEHIGSIDEELKESIKKELEKLKNSKKNKPAEWRFPISKKDETMNLQAQEELQVQVNPHQKNS